MTDWPVKKELNFYSFQIRNQIWKQLIYKVNILLEMKKKSKYAIGYYLAVFKYFSRFRATIFRFQSSVYKTFKINRRKEKKNEI